MSTDAAVDFLKLFHPTGYWVLTAIEPNKTRIETATFEITEAHKAHTWIENYNHRRNIYFSVAQPKDTLTKKAEKGDIAYTRYLHVDIDARAGEPLEAECARIYDMLTTKRVKEVPEPTFLVFSGGGFQAFWRLTEEVTINGDLPTAVEFERYNKMLEITLGADRCHNVDRIMRLPGTLNIPDQKKLARGRTPAEAKLLSSSGPEVSLRDMKQAPAVQTTDLGWDGAAPRVRLPSGEIQRITDLNKLDEWGVSLRIKAMIAQGVDPDNPTHHVSRSERLFEVCCDLVRHEVPVEVIYSLITDPLQGISAHILDQKGDLERYAIRQIERAQEEVEEPWLRQLNERYAVIQNMGGKCRVIEEIFDSIVSRTRLTKMSFPDFRNAWLNHKVEIGSTVKGKPITKPAGQWWLENQRRRQYDRLVFSPGRPVNGAYNLWQGFRVEPKKGSCDKFLNHIHDNLCRNDDKYFEYLIRWMALCVQRPDLPGMIAVVLQGKQGTGKSFFATHFGELFGRHFLQVADAKHLVGAFNAHLRDCCVLFGDEAFYAGDKKHESVLKTLVTERTLHYEAKGVDSEQGPNFIHLIMASNSEWVVPADMDDRRFFVLHVGDRRINDRKYFRDIKNELESGGYEALLYMLMNLDLSDFDVAMVPKTAALREQQLLSMEPLEEWWYRKLEDGRMLRHHGEWVSSITCTALIDDYLRHNKDFNITRRASETALGMFLKKVVPGDDMPQRKQKTVVIEEETDTGFLVPQSKRMWHYELPPLEDCREQWEDLFNTSKAMWPWPKG